MKKISEENIKTLKKDFQNIQLKTDNHTSAHQKYS